MKTVNAFGVAAATGLMLAAGAALAPGAASAADGQCADVEMVFARGTFEAPGVGKTGQAFVDAVQARMPNKTIDVYGVDYPASLDFGAAVNGVVDASNRIRSVAASCPNTKIVTGGYSQGAAVAAYTTLDAVPQDYALPDGLGPLPSDVAKHVAAVALFGKPSSGFMQIVDGNAPPITVGSRFASKTIELCVEGDPVCAPGGRDRGAHSRYVTDGFTEQAADFVAGKLGVKAGAPRPVAPVDLASAPAEPVGQDAPAA